MSSVCRFDCLRLVISKEAECDDGQPDRGQHRGQLVGGGGAEYARPLPDEDGVSYLRDHNSIPVGALHILLQAGQAARDHGGQEGAHHQEQAQGVQALLYHEQGFSLLRCVLIIYFIKYFLVTKVFL